MNDYYEGSPWPPQHGRQPIGPSASRRRRGPRQLGPAAPANTGSPFSLWLILELLLRRWYWLLLGTSLCAGLLGFAAARWIQPKYTATALLLRYDLPGTSDFFKSVISAETFAGMIRSPELLRQVGAHATPAIPPEVLTKLIKVDPDPESDMVRVLLAANEPRQAVDLLNHYVSNAVAFTRSWYAQQAETVASNYLQKQVLQMDQDIAAISEHFRGIRGSPLVSNKLAQVGGELGSLSTNLAAMPASSALIARQTERLNLALGELTELMSKYTELHPLVRQKESEVKALQNLIARETTNRAAAGLPPLPTDLVTRPGEAPFNPELDLIRTKLLSLEEGRVQLANRQREAELYANNPPGLVRVFAPATPQTVKQSLRWLKLALVTLVGGCLGFGASLGLVFLVEIVDNRLKGVEDVSRVTGLPVLGCLGNLHKMSPENRAAWAFRTWTMLQGRLSPSPNHGLVCGFTSSHPGEGRSTWVQLLAEAASLTGFRVLTIATRPSPTHVEVSSSEQPGPLNGATHEELQPATDALTANVLSSPAQVTEQLTGPNSQPVVHIPLPGWVWNLERRRQWREALDQWRQIENLVIFVELPAATMAEAVLLGSSLPNLVWLTHSRKADAATTRTQLEMLRHARCHLVGAVLNHWPGRSLKRRFARWVSLGLLCALPAPGSAWAQLPAPEPPAANAPTNAPSFSVLRPPRAPWQQRLTLGPGDVLTFALFGEPDATRAEVAVGPDGRISFLEAHDVPAAGSTVDELRARLDQELGKFRRSPRSIITPVAFRSKRYYMLGKIMTKGVYVLDRPLTVLEAVARAHGFENGLVDRNVIDLADFQRSFLMRAGKRYALDFDRLFRGGDLSQNLPIEPGDYLYFASADVPEVYVVGEVRLPGTVTYTPDLTILGAITARAGYSDRAYKARVLVVRGSLNHPHYLAVDTHAVLDAKGLDFKLQPKDIIFVNSRPFIRVEELADLAITAFLQGLITSWVGVDVVKPFDQ